MRRLVLLILLLAPLRAYNPPVDTAGPITARIAGPSEITQAETPIEVVIENSGDGALQGAVRLRVIDSWRADPAGAVAFRVGAHGSTSLRFRLTAGEGTLSALYPVHAYVEFEAGGRRLAAHPILIVSVRLPGSPRPPVLSAKPAPAAETAPADGSRPLGKLGRYEVSLRPGRHGVLDSWLSFTSGGQRLTLRGFQVTLPGDLVEAREETAPGRYRVRHRFQSPAGPFDLLAEIWTEAGAVRVKFRLENTPRPRPWIDVHIEDIAAGAWSEMPARLYLGQGNVVVEPRAFRLGFDGQSLASSFVGFDFSGLSLVEAVDVPPTSFEFRPEASSGSLHTSGAQTVTLIPAASVWQAVRVWHDINGLKAAGGVRKLAGRFVFDFWRAGPGSYARYAEPLEKAFSNGLTDSVVVWHNWQRWGYDYRLPDIYPPNPNYGSFDDFLKLVKLCRKYGVLFAPHDNYIDSYPDADAFTYDDIAFDRNGQPVRAWLNRGRQAQSYRFRADRVRPFVERNLPLIREGFAPTAYFIDVWSSLGPYEYWTRDGRYFPRVSTRDTWREIFAWIRAYLGDYAPQISESGHDQLVGYLDGAQANHFRVEYPRPNIPSPTVLAIPCADAERIPWMDAAHHDRFVLHGAGYETRYLAGLDRKTHGIYSDDYISTEVLTGHPPMVPDAFNDDVVRKYRLLHDLARALALRRIVDVRFAAGNIHRQHVTWEGGGEVWVNRSADDWGFDGHVLPQYGFYARVGGVEAGIERRGGKVVEWSKSEAGRYERVR